MEWSLPRAGTPASGSARAAGRRVHRIEKAALVPHDAASVFRLVADVGSYPSFLPGCTAARVVRVDENVVEASLRVAKGPFHHWFTTRNTLHPNERIELALVEGPFRTLRGEWRFATVEGGTRISLELEFELSNRVLGKVLAPAFAEVTSRMVDAFATRARELEVIER